MKTGLNKPTNRSSAIAEHLLNNSDCTNNYRISIFSIICKACSEYHLNVLESLFKKHLNLIYASNNLFINLFFISCYNFCINFIVVLLQLHCFSCTIL